MRVVRTPKSMQARALAWRKAGQRVAFVPTMGFLHEGHLDLMRMARAKVGPRGLVVASIFVNPTQFGPAEDLSRYPRDPSGDRRRCASVGVDVLFLPTEASMYPRRDGGLYSTYVIEEKLSQGMEGASRPTHFRGVATVVAKLFNCVLPEVAVFGAKDWQQAAVVQRMTANLNFPVRIVVAPTTRETDGLAMSSRNAYLAPEERRQATIVPRVIDRSRARLREAGPMPAADLLKAIAGWVSEVPLARLDYAALFDPQTLEPASEARRGVQLALAVWFGKTRLIDNGRL